MFEGKNTPERLMLAQRLRGLRAAERLGRYLTTRDMFAYEEVLGGFTHLLKYAKSLTESNRILDIGAGSTIATNEIARSILGKDLDFYATGLSPHPLAKQNLGSERIHIASAERLRRIPDDSIACIIGIFSVTYTWFPEAVVEEVDRILVPGGAFKSNFLAGRDSRDTSLGAIPKYYPFSLDLNSHHPFSKRFKQLGYAVAVKKDFRGSDILLVVKGGANQESSIATELIKEDLKPFIRPWPSQKNILF